LSHWLTNMLVTFHVSMKLLILLLLLLLLLLLFTITNMRFFLEFSNTCINS